MSESPITVRLRVMAAAAENAPTQKSKSERREEIHYRVALLLANGARIRAVCRVPGCDWQSQAFVKKFAAEYERTAHQGWHIDKAAPSRPVTPS